MAYRRSIAFIGGGNMAEALAAGITRAGILPASSIVIAEPLEDRRHYLAATYGFSTTPDNHEATAASGTVFLAVKPQILRHLVEEMAPSLQGTQLVISIAAGITLSFLESMLPGIPLIRSMPNTPALLGCGATAVSAGHLVQPDMTHWAVELFHSVGTCHVLAEELMDAVTGLSGSGPAYIFRLTEALTRAGAEVGIPEDQSCELVKQTILGAARMLTESGKSPAELRKMVTSPGGTTEAGIRALADGGFEETLVKAVKAATRRAEELGKG